jgi:dTDP-glucose pyrophosphorylase/CBS domain-containing protein
VGTTNISDLFVTLSTPIRDVIKTIDRSGRISIALVVDDDKRLRMTITDGDIRRAIMAGISLDAPTERLLPLKALLPNPQPVTAPLGADTVALLEIMQERCVRQIPLVDEQGRPTDIVVLADLLPKQKSQVQAMIMAGGYGTRLRPLTDDVAKPMLPVGGRPILERIVGQLKEAGIHQILVSTHYKPETIVQHFGNGRAFDVELHYVQEEQPMGTGGALGMMPPPQGPILVINGDILTQMDFRAMFEFHEEQGADMTVAVRHYGLQVPYGVMECDGAHVKGVSEKPQLNFFVNAGIYVLDPAVFQYIPSEKPFHMTDLIRWLLEADRSVVSFPILEYWLDIGQPDDYARAQQDARKEEA